MDNCRADTFYRELLSRMGEVTAALDELAPPCGYPIYASMDVRDSGWKTCVVDVNLFPAGFNILSEADKAMGAARMKNFFAQRLGGAGPWKIAVVPEAHTNNAGYLENLAGILGLLKLANCEPRLLWPGLPIPKPWIIKTRSGASLEYLPRDQALDGAQALVLNHDLSGGIPAAIKDVSLPTFPSTRLGWYRRRKSTHQEIVDALLAKLHAKLDFFDPWYFSARSVVVADLNLDDEASFHRLHSEADALFATLSTEYAERRIPVPPTVFLKNDAGTYGIGVVNLVSPGEVLTRRAWLRDKIRKGKEAVPITQLILQEGVPTALSYGEVSAEPTMYLVDGAPIGGFLRIHEGLGAGSDHLNLNQPGSKLEPMDCSAGNASPRPFPLVRGQRPCEHLLPGQVYAFLARLHATAAGLEDCPR